MEQKGTRLKIWFSQGSGGSSPSAGTITNSICYGFQYPIFRQEPVIKAEIGNLAMRPDPLCPLKLSLPPLTNSLSSEPEIQPPTSFEAQLMRSNRYLFYMRSN